MRGLGLIYKILTKNIITSSKIDMYKFLVLHVMLSAGNNLIMAKYCVAKLDTFRQICVIDVSKCTDAMKDSYGSGAIGWCDIFVLPKNICGCTYPCESI